MIAFWPKRGDFSQVVDASNDGVQAVPVMMKEPTQTRSGTERGSGASPFRILLIEDDPRDARLLEAMVLGIKNARFHLETVPTVAEGLQRLAAGGIDLALLDLTLPDSIGLETVTQIRARNSNVPIIVMSGQEDEALAVEAVKQGAQDYLVKGMVNSFWLARAMRYAIERHHIEEELRASRAFYHSLVENMPQCLFRKDLEGRFTFANGRFCQMTAKSLDEILGKTDFDFYPHELAEKYRRDDQEVVRTGGLLDSVEEFEEPGGERVFVKVIKTPIADQQGKAIGLQGIFWEVSDAARLKRSEPATTV